MAKYLHEQLGPEVRVAVQYKIEISDETIQGQFVIFQGLKITEVGSAIFGWIHICHYAVQNNISRFKKEAAKTHEQGWSLGEVAKY